jgi:CBS domain-containing protein
MLQPQAPPLARDYMNRKVRCLSPGMTLHEVIGYLLAHGLSSAPVVEDHDGHRVLVGLVSELDCLEHLSNDVFYDTPSPPHTAASMMRRHPLCVLPDTELFALASIFLTHGMRHLPVVENGDLVGLVSRRDILKALEQHAREVSPDQDRHYGPLDMRDVLTQRFVVTPVRRTRRAETDDLGLPRSTP